MILALGNDNKSRKVYFQNKLLLIFGFYIIDAIPPKARRLGRTEPIIKPRGNEDKLGVGY